MLCIKFENFVFGVIVLKNAGFKLVATVIGNHIFQLQSNTVERTKQF